MARKTPFVLGLLMLAACDDIGATVTLPSRPLECDIYTVQAPKYLGLNEKIRVVAPGGTPILGFPSVFLTMPLQILQVQFRGGEWQDPVKDCRA